MKNSCQNNNDYANLIISDLVNLGILHFCIGSGSRSAPLALALENNLRTQTVVYYDERSLGFFALGLAKGLKAPVCIITTSGSATVNIFPAVMEAYMDNIPLIVITCDRPFEDLDRGANQTCNQEGIFGHYVDCFKTILAPPHPFESFVISSLLSYITFRAKDSKSPVHLNIPFKEPLISETSTNSFSNSLVKYLPIEKTFSKDSLDYIIDILSSCDRGIIIAAGNYEQDASNEILTLGEKLGYPIFADPLSGIRELGRSSATIAYYNQILASIKELSNFKPQVILYLGGHLISKTILTWLQNLTNTHQIVVNDINRNTDPTFCINTKISMKPSEFAKAINSKLPFKTPTLFQALWKSYSLTVETLILDFFEEEEEFCEPMVITNLLPIINQRPLPIFLGNSLSVRYGDNFLFLSQLSKKIYGNRGVSGIDGNISTALGISKALNSPLIAVIGDATFLHDVGALSLMKKQNIPLILIVINNNGGGIFEFLPYSNNKKLLNNKISPPTDINIGNIAASFDISFWRANNCSEYQKMILHLLEEKKGGIIEVITDSKKNVQIDKKLKAYLETTIDKSLKKEKNSYFYLKKKSFAFTDS